MGDAVMISIHPKWCEMIASEKKTVEVRKNYPRLKTPFKCYIYETKDMSYQYRGEQWWRDDGSTYGIAHFPGKVIGEFVCDDIYAVLLHPGVFAGRNLFYEHAIDAACLTNDEVEKYSGGKDLYGWHISDLVIYDRPVPLEAFGLKIAPQSWRYVEDIKKTLGIKSPSEAWRQLDESPELVGGTRHE